MLEWRFRRMQPGEMNVDPIEAEFFSTASLDSLTDALVRESIQNSLDARIGDDPVRVRIAFPPSVPAPQRWFAGLWPHLQASHSGIAEVPDQRSPLPFLIVEDFGTRGLQGDPTQSEDDILESTGARNDFYYFWRNIGRSRKGSSDLGRWGLGKTVFPAASRINAFLGMTQRADDGRTMLMGQSVLRIHKLADSRFYPYGYFGNFLDEFARPFEECELVEEFHTTFASARTTEPGLSVVVPWPDPAITPDAVLASVIRHYFAPILGGDLSIEVVDGGNVRHVDATNLNTTIISSRSGLSTTEASSLERLVRLARFGLNLPRSEYIRLEEPPASNAPRWTRDCLVGVPDDVGSRFEAGLPIAFTVPVWVKETGVDPLLSQFDVYLQRDESLSRGEEHFVREGITVAGVRGGVPKGVRAVLVAQDRPIATLLGDSENPAHTEWQERSPKFKDRYQHGPFTLRYVRNAPREIARAITRPATGRHESLLQHLFSLDLPTEASVLETTRAGADAVPEGRSTGSTVESPGGSPAAVALQKTAGGFRLVGSGHGIAPDFVILRAAYEVRRGDPFARYQRPDFDLAAPSMTITTEAVTVEQASGNLLALRVLDPRFRLEVEGFDRHRDIRVRVTTGEAAT